MLAGIHCVSHLRKDCSTTFPRLDVLPLRSPPGTLTGTSPSYTFILRTKVRRTEYYGPPHLRRGGLSFDCFGILSKLETCFARSGRAERTFSLRQSFGKADSGMFLRGAFVSNIVLREQPPNSRFDRSAKQLRCLLPSSLRSSAPGQPER